MYYTTNYANFDPFGRICNDFNNLYLHIDFNKNLEYINKTYYFRLIVFSFLPTNVHFIPKNAISCLFLKNVSPSKRVICFILNNINLPMVEDIAFYALHKSRVLIIPCKADGFRLFIGLPDEISNF